MSKFEIQYRSRRPSGPYPLWESAVSKNARSRRLAVTLPKADKVSWLFGYARELWAEHEGALDVRVIRVGGNRAAFCFRGREFR